MGARLISNFFFKFFFQDLDFLDCFSIVSENLKLDSIEREIQL